MLSIFDMDNLNGALFLNARPLFERLLTLVPSTVIVSFTTIYASVSSHKSYCSIGVLNLILFLTEYCPFDKSFTSTHFLVTQFGTNEFFSNIYILCSFTFYNTCLNSFKITSLFAGGIIISSTFLELGSGIGFGLTIFLVILLPINASVASVVLWITF